MSLADTLRADLTKYVDPVVRVLEIAQSLTGIGGAGAATALKTIEAMIKTLETGVASQLTAKDILAELDKLAPGVAANDAAAVAANAAELAKYPAEGG